MLPDWLFLRKFASRALIAAALALSLVPHQAFAACSSPTGVEGEIVYNGTYHVTQFCDGSSWISMAAAATYLSETDPKVGTLTALKWCATNAGGTAIDCTLDAPLRTANNLSDLASSASARTNLGLGSIATQAASAVTITGGTINSTAIGGTTPAAGAFTTLSASGDFAVNTNKFTVAASSGNTVVAGTLNVTGVITGVGSGLTTLNASNLSSGTVATARLGSGTANTTTFLRGDNSWAAPTGGTLAALTDVSLSSPSNTQLLGYNGSAWTNSSIGSLVAGVAGPSFHVNKNGTAQTVTSATWTKLTWSNEVFDTNNNFASDRFTPTVAGKYLIMVTANCNAGTGNCYAGIFKNGSELTQSTGAATGLEAQATASLVVDMNGSSDYIEGWVFNSATTTVSGNTVHTYMSGSMLAPLASGVVAGTGSANYIPYWTSGNALTYDSTSGGQFYWDSTNHRLGIGTATPSTLLDVNGAATLRSTLAVTGNVSLTGTETGATGVGIGTASVASTALLDMVSTTKGMLPPRMTTTQRDAISSPATGLTIYNTTTNQVNVYTGSAWATVGGTALSGLTTDVNLTSPANSDILQYSSGTSKWVNTQLVSAVAGVAGPSFSVNKNGTNQTVTANTYTKLTWSNEVFDTNNNFASDKFTPTVAGKYLINVNVNCTTSGAGFCLAIIYKNGAHYATSQQYTTATVDLIPSLSVVLDMNGSTDYVEAYVYTGGTTVGGSSIYTSFTGSMLAPLASGVVAGTGSAGYVPVWTSGNALTYDSTSNGQFYWDSTNHRLGIGTTSPLTTAHVAGSSASPSGELGSLLVTGGGSQYRLVLGYNNSSDYGWIQSVHNGVNASSLVLNANGGNVGIGTASPGSALDVKGTLRLSGSTSGYVGIAPAAAAGSVTYTLPSADGSSGQVLSTNGSGTLSWATASGSSQWTTSGSNIYYNTGNVGIGTASPSNKLDVSGTVSATSFSGAGTGLIGTASSLTASNVTALAGTWDGISYFRSNKGASSTVGANSSYALEAFASDGGAAGMSFHRSGAYAVNMGLDPDNVFRIGGWSASSNRLQLDMSGNLTIPGLMQANGHMKINNASPTIYLQDTDHYSAMIHNNSNLFYILSGCGVNSASWCQNANSYWPLYINMTNNDAVFGGNVYAFNYYHNSDIRLKRDIASMPGLDLVTKLRGVEFTWKASGVRAGGVIAQEVEKVLPTAVHQDKDGTKSVDYDMLIAPLIEAVKELKADNDNLRARLKRLENARAAAVH